jgi:hypothetical protein
VFITPVLFYSEYDNVFVNENGKLKLPNCYILFKEHKDKLVIELYEDSDFKIMKYIPSRFIITYPHIFTSEWRNILHDISLKMFKGFKCLLNNKFKDLKLLMLKDSIELYNYINFVDCFDKEYEDKIILESFSYTYDVVELYDKLQHKNIKDIIDKCYNEYKIINNNEKLILLKHLDTLFVRVGSNILGGGRTKTKSTT